MPPAISLRQVVKNYRRGKESVAVLHGLNLEIPQGEFVSLMGPSGSGKTTILNLVGGLDHIGFIFQFYNLMPMLSAAGNVELPLLLTNLSKAERRRRVAVALEIVGLADRAAHKPGEMSGGQQQRVGIARAIVADPPILLCDEPTGDLDRTTADEILSLLQQLNRQHSKTIVMVTHDPKAADHASRQLEMDKGQLIERGMVVA